MLTRSLSLAIQSRAQQGTLLNQTPTYYISTAANGGNNSNNGSIGSPWLTLTYACTQVTTPGDIIHVNAGTYAETAQSVLSLGVSIVGEGNTSIISSTYVSGDAPTIKMYSATQGTNGNQSVSYIKMDGNNLTAYMAIEINCRSNVKIHHCEFVNFSTKGVTFSGLPFNQTVVTTWSTGNSFYNNLITNCGAYTGAGQPNLGIGGQDGILVYNNTITQTDRGNSLNGYGIASTDGGYCKGMKIYNNTISVPTWDGSTWDFAMEIFATRGGVEIYNNTLEGTLDFSSYSDGTGICNDEGGYGYAVKVYGNTIGQSALRTHLETALDIEHDIEGGFYVYNNTLRNVSKGICFSFISNTHMEDIYIHNNLILNIGRSGTNNVGLGIDIGTGSGHTIDNLNIWNNTLVGTTVNTTLSGIRQMGGTGTGLLIRNNIIQGFDDACIKLNSATITTLSIENNDFYQNGGSNAVDLTSSTITGNITQNNITTNPTFVSTSDFHLDTGSPCIGTGVDVELMEDFEGNPIVGLPDIGAYEKQ